MKTQFASKSAFSHLGVLAVSLFFLAGIFLALFATAKPPGLGSVAFANAAAKGEELSTKALSSVHSNVTGNLDNYGYRPNRIPFAPSGRRKNRVAGITNVWSSLGPPGGDVADVAVSTIDPNIVLAGVAPEDSVGGTLYRSSDGGDTWVEVPALTGTSVFDIEFAVAGNAYIATIDGVRESTDGGLTWMARNLGIGPNDQVLDVALDPSNASILWAGIADASGAQPINVMRSTDGGVTWANRTPPLAAPISGEAIAVDPGDSNTVIAVFGGAFGGGQVWVTTDSGNQWTNRSTGLPNNPMRAVVYDGTRLLVGGGQLFGSESVGLYRSTDLGATWAALHNSSWPTRVVPDIAVDPNDSQIILVATDGTGVHRTTDGGATWQISIGGTAGLSGRSLRFRPGSSTDLFLGNSSLAVFRSTNGGDMFASSSHGISLLNLYSIHANPLYPWELAVAFQGANNGGVFSSTDGGITWLLEPAPGTRYSAVRFAPDGTLYAISSGPSTIAPEGLYRRELNGSWTSLGPNQGPLYESDLDTMHFSVNNAKLILLGGADFGVAGNEGTIWRTPDAGQTWTKVYEFGDSQPVTDLEIVEDGFDQVMIASHDDLSGSNGGGALRSTDGGVSWLPSSSGLPATFLRNPRLCASPNDPQTFYFSAWLSFSSSGLFRTTDGGATWASTGWTGAARADDVESHPGGQLLFITLELEGSQVARSEDGGVTFMPFAQGLDGVIAPRELAVAGADRLVLASAAGSYGTEAPPTPTPTVSPSPTSSPTPSPSPSPSPTSTPSPTPTPTPSLTPPTRAQNLSTRLLVGTGSDVGIGGFIITGTDPRQILSRGIGPSITGVSNPLADPVLSLGGMTNDNWRDTQEKEILATGLAPTNNLESAILITLNPGPYTAILSGKNDGVGVGLVELYDLTQSSASKMANLSTRASVGTGGNIVITGFILGGGTNDETILLRGLGPSLGSSGITNPLANPTLELRNSEGALLASNDDWQNGPPINQLPPTDPLESAIEMPLSAGAYTALLSGVNGETGVALVEVYDLGGQ